MQDFHLLSRYIKVGDIATPVVGYIKASDAAFDAASKCDDEAEKLGLSEAKEQNIALVVDEKGSIVGWTTSELLSEAATEAAAEVDWDEERQDEYEKFLYGVKVSDCLRIIFPDAIVTYDTPLLDAVSLFKRPRPQFYFVLQETQIIGTLHFYDLFKLRAKLAMLALLLECEEEMLAILQLNPQESVNLFDSTELERLEGLYKGWYRNKWGKKPDPNSSSISNFDELRILMGRDTSAQKVESKSKFPAQGLLDVSGFKEKIAVLKRIPEATQQIPSLKNDKHCEMAPDFRNDIVHPKTEATIHEKLNQKVLPSFIEWAECFYQELSDYRKSVEAAKKKLEIIHL